jgi:hypothetical protein
VITKNQIPWEKCAAFFVDNASVNMGKRSSNTGRVLVKNSDVYFIGCPLNWKRPFPVRLKCISPLKSIFVKLKQKAAKV